MNAESAPSAKRRPGTVLAPADVALWNWPPIHDGWMALPPVGLLVAAFALGYWQAVDWRLPWIATGATAIALWRFWTPTWFELSIGGVAQTTLGRTRRIPWIAVRRFDLDPHGVWLFPTREADGADYLRGLYIRFAGRRKEVVEAVTYYLGAWAVSPDAPTETHVSP